MRVAPLQRLARRHGVIGILFAALLLAVGFYISSGGQWGNILNLASIAQMTAILGILALGQALVLGTGEIDVSVGSTFSFCALVYLGLFSYVPTLMAILISIGSGVLIGVLNGVIVIKFRVPSLIVTLGVLMIFRGLSIALTDGFSFSVPYEDRGSLIYEIFGGGDFFGVNSAGWWVLVLLLILLGWVFRTASGNHLLATGGDLASAQSCGIKTGRVKTVAFMACGALAGFAGILEASKLGYADGSMGRLMELQVIAAAILGGCALTGGRISFLGVVVAAFILSSMQSYLVIMGVRPQWFVLLLGAIVIVAALGERIFRDFATKKLH